MCYYYRIQDVITGIYYIGSRYSVNSHPDEFWVTYFTSSETVKKLVELHGPERFEVQKVIPKSNAYLYETKLLQKLDARNHSKFYNMHNNTGIEFGSLESKKKSSKTRQDNKIGIYSNEVRSKRAKEQGKANANSGHLDEIRKLVAKHWLVWRDGIEPFEITNMKEFCRVNNLSNGTMGMVSRGVRKHHKGWKCKKL